MAARPEYRTRLNRSDWLQAALDTLCDVGIAGVTIERVASVLGVTRGSFYHHFADREELLRELLELWKQRWTVEIRQEVMSLQLDPSNALLVLVRTIRRRRGASYDVYFRAWALHDPLARKVVKRVDEIRLGYIRELFEALGFEGLDAENRARMFLYYEMSEPSMFAAQSAKLTDQLIRERHALLTAAHE
jgi:AcrR family transcriptional regulator